MRLIFTILFLYAFAANSQTTYYISNNGDDTKNGTSPATAWKTLAKENSFTHIAGDQILLQTDNSWNEILRPKASGTIANPIKYGSYGTGSMPMITGLQPVTGLINASNIWTATIPNAAPSLNNVLYNGKQVAKGRYPNTDVLHWTTNRADTGINGAITTNYIGAEVAFYTMHWIIDVVKIKSQSADVMLFETPLTYTNPNYNAYFIQNDVKVLDTAGEWCMNDTTKVFKIYSPNTPDVQVSVIDTLIDCSKRSNIIFDGLSIIGSNKIALLFDSTQNITTINCSFNNHGRNAIQANPSRNVVIKNTDIFNTQNIGARVFGPHLLFDNNHLKNIGYLAGMGGSGNGMYMGLYCGDSAKTITNNRADTIGYIPFYWEGDSSLIENNVVNYFGHIKEDGGAFYTYKGGKGSILRNNMAENGIGLPTVFGYGTPMAVGFYLDDGVPDGIANITLQGNTSRNTAYAGLFLHGNRNVKVYDNTFIDSVGHPIRIENNYFTNSLDHDIKRNIFYSQSTAFETMLTTSITNIGTDSNYYVRPVLETNKIKAINTSYSLPAWSTYDAHAFSTPSGITTALPLIQLNNTTSYLTNALSGTYVNPKLSYKNNLVVLPPFTSEILFKTVSENPLKKLSNLKILSFKK